MGSYKLDISKEPELRKFLSELEFKFEDFAYAFWKGTAATLKVTFYKIGKLLLQGKGADEMVDLLIQNKIIDSGVSEDVWMGTDEAGKGDYFGPLVVAGVMVRKEHETKLLKAGVSDSKGLSDIRISELAEVIRAVCLFSVVVIGPPKYNELIARMKNLNKLMGWGHARVIENLLEKESCSLVISDKFGDESYIVKSLGDKGRKVNLKQRVRAESDLAVAAASILARDTFVKKIQNLSDEFSIDLPKGANPHVIDAGKAFIQKYGKEKLSSVAKMHFRTTQQVFE